MGFAQDSTDIFGTWISIDDKTGKERSKIEIYKKGNKAFGKIVKFLENPNKETTQRCTECPEDDDRKDQLVFGMEIIRDLELDGDKWEDGTILDPEEGKVYDCKIWQEEGKLKVRGYIAFFYRTQEWIKDNSH
ncbi:MAG: DUF2147 domain-containing protein [Bacteroidota bacterium]